MELRTLDIKNYTEAIIICPSCLIGWQGPECEITTTMYKGGSRGFNFKCPECGKEYQLFSGRFALGWE